MRLSGAFLLLATIVGLDLMATAQNYTVTDLGTLAANISVARALNDVGQVVGLSYYSPTTSASHAFLWTATAGMRDLGTLGGYSSNANAINNAGAVVGCSDVFENNGPHPFLWTESGGMQDLGSIAGDIACATGINNLGQIVGYTGTVNSWMYAFLWTPSAGMQIINVAPGSIAYGINDAGQVVGTFPYSGTDTHGFLWTKSEGMQDLGSLGVGSATAAAINSAGAVVGDSLVPPANSDLYFGFLWTPTAGIRSLPSLATEEDASAASINSAGQIVGGGFAPDFEVHALLWDAERRVHDLNQMTVNSPLILEDADAINNHGQIVGVAHVKTNYGQQHAYLLTPTGK